MSARQLKTPTGNAPGGPGGHGGKVSATVAETVHRIIDDVRAHGDDAVREHSARLDGWAPESFLLAPEEVGRIVATVPTQVLDDLRAVQANVRNFAQLQRDSMVDIEVETAPGVRLGQRHLPIDAAGAREVAERPLDGGGR